MENTIVRFVPRPGKDFGKGIAYARRMGATFDGDSKTWSLKESKIMIGSYGRDLRHTLIANYCRIVD